MVDTVTATPDAGAPETPLTDEQLTAAFPGQDLTHLRSMMAKSDPAPAGDGSTTTPATPAVTYPDWIPEKFRAGTVEEASQKMAEAYKSLEQTQSGKPDASAAATTDTTPAPDPAAAAADPTSPMAQAESEYATNDGVITAETYAKLATNGMSKEFVDNYFAGQSAIANQLVTKVHEAAGGEKAYEQLMTWAAANWSESEIAAYDAVTAGNSVESIKLAVSGLKAAMVAQTGTNPTLVLGDSDTTGPTGAAYSSRSEMTADMKKPEYKADPAFRAQVAQKVANSKVW